MEGFVIVMVHRRGRRRSVRAGDDHNRSTLERRHEPCGRKRSHGEQQRDQRSTDDAI
jgi:hypothetical protein